MKDQRCALVSRETSRKSDGERVRIEQSSHRNDLTRIDSVNGPSSPRALARKGEELALEEQMDIPEFFIRNVDNAIPEGNVIMPVHPLGPEITVEELPEFGRDPRRRMNSIGHVM